MTIVTKPITEKKGDKLEQPLVDNKTNEALVLPNSKDVEANNARLLTPLPRYMVRADRFTNATTLCLFLTAMLVMSIGVISGVYIYRQFARTQLRHFHGFCGIPYDHRGLSNDDLRLAAAQRDSRLFKSGFQDSGMITSDTFQEEFELDLELEDYATITVPDFRGGRNGRFIHDFSANKTGIVDIEGHRCFVMPLNRNVVLPPRSLYDLVNKIYDGYYQVNTETIRETMKVVVPRITDYKKVGIYIAKECRKMSTYMLEKVSMPVFKRSADQDATFGEFAGHSIQEVVIMNVNALEEYERNNPPAAEQH